MDVTPSPLPPLNNHRLLPRLLQISDNSVTTNLYAGQNRGPCRHSKYQVSPFPAILLFTPTILTIACPIEPSSFKLAQAGKVSLRYNNYIATIATIATIRSSKGDILLLPEAYRTVPPITCLYPYLCSIKHIKTITSYNFLQY